MNLQDNNESRFRGLLILSFDIIFLLYIKSSVFIRIKALPIQTN